MNNKVGGKEGDSVDNNIEAIQDVSIVLCGEAGHGIESIFSFLSTLLKDEGYNIFATKEYMSRVRGGANSTSIRISSKPREGYIERIDILIPLDDGTMDHLASRITDKTIIIGDKSAITTTHKIIDVPFTDIASDIGSKILANTVATATILGIFNCNIQSFHNVLANRFKSKSKEIIDSNIAAATKGYELGLNILKDHEDIRKLCIIDKHPEIKDHVLMYGAESIGMGAIVGGCNFISAYPMSPSTGILTYLESRKSEFDIIVEQAEDEISGINMAIGAWYAGARALVNSSGGGFALMVEGVSLAGMMESPLVIHIAQRPGPATGLPTRTAQEDLELALYSGHGEFCRIIYAPGNTTEAFYTMHKAFNMAALFQIPVFVLTDQYFMDTINNTKTLDIDNLEIDQHIVQTTKEYNRYKLTQDLISPRGIPGNGEGLVCADSDEHDESGHITESMDVRNLMVNKRLSKFKDLELSVLPPTIIGAKDYSTLIISWGTTYGSVKEAVENINKKDITYMHFNQVYPIHPELSSWIKKAKKVIVIENNATAQFAKLIKRETGLSTEHILKFDGMAFSVEELVKKINELY